MRGLPSLPDISGIQADVDEKFDAVLQELRAVRAAVEQLVTIQEGK